MAERASDDVDELRDQLTREKVSREAWLEEASGVLESVERKRKQVAARSSREARGGNGFDPTDPDAARAHYEQQARERGML